VRNVERFGIGGRIETLVHFDGCHHGDPSECQCSRALGLWWGLVWTRAVLRLRGEQESIELEWGRHARAPWRRFHRRCARISMHAGKALERARTADVAADVVYLPPVVDP
jgi:hypothetical protein